MFPLWYNEFMYFYVFINKHVRDYSILINVFISSKTETYFLIIYYVTMFQINLNNNNKKKITKGIECECHGYKLQNFHKILLSFKG